MKSITRTTWTATVPLYAILFLSCLLPLLWMLSHFIREPHLLSANHLSRFQLSLIARTLLYNGSAALLATLMALPAAIVVGRGRGVMAKVLLFLLPIGLVMPSITYTYAWLQFFHLCHIQFIPASPADVLRCIWTLASWLWPLPALAIGLALRFMDSQVQQQAILDGVLWRVTWRQLAGAVLASFAMVFVLTIQEFAVYERSGISVISVEARTVFETGAFSNGDAKFIIQAQGGTGVLLRSADQESRAAAALATSVPMLILVTGLTMASLILARRISAAETLESGGWPRILDARWKPKLITAGLLILTLTLPIAALYFSLAPNRRHTDLEGHSPPLRIWLWAGEYVRGSLYYAGLTGLFALALAFLSTIRRSPGLLLLSLLVFLIGGELLAIADIRLYNRIAPWPLERIRVSGHDLFGWIYNNEPVMVIAYLGRFSWLALLAGNSMWSRPFQEIRDIASLDGAGPWRTAHSVIAPIAWPVLLASGVLVLTLSMTEVSASVLLSPQRPQMLIPTLMGWVHMLNYDSMIEGSLLLMGMVGGLGLVAFMLTAMGLRLSRVMERGRR